jgi:hypothetical protein
VGGDELLLLAERAQEPERVGPESDHADRRDGEQAAGARERDPPALTCGSLAEHQERQEQAGCELDPDAGGERERRAPRPCRRVVPGRAGRAQQQREPEREQQQGVVVRAADREHEQHRVQPEERECERARAAQAAGRFSGEPDRPEAADGAERLQRPQTAGEAERRSRVAREREDGSVGRVLERPADEAENGIAPGFGGEVGVGVQAVQRAHAREREIAEHVLRDQRGPEQQDHVGRDHGCRDRRERKCPGRHQRDQVAPADHEHEHLEAALPELRAETAQRAGEPARPAAAVGGHVLRGGGCGIGAENCQRRQQGTEREPPSHLQRRGGRPLRARLNGPARGSPEALGLPGSGRRRSARGLHGAILTASRPASIHGAR